ncbi:hypothetical protein ACFXPK_32155, partial [Streptomyces sp. NPDC059142]
GNHHCLGSGGRASGDLLDGGGRPVPDAGGAARPGVAADGSYARAFDTARRRVTELTERGAAGELPGISPYYTATTAPGYLPGLLARYHLAADGTPLPAAARTAENSPGGVRRVVREAVRGAARGAYRHGVQRVAPVIRRMGEL